MQIGKKENIAEREGMRGRDQAKEVGKEGRGGEGGRKRPRQRK